MATVAFETASELPAEIANLGEPEQVFAPGPARMNATNIGVAVSCAVVGLLLFGIAGIFFAELNKPLGPKPLPRSGAWTGTVGCSVVAMLFLGVGVWYAGRALVRIPREYRFYKDVLVERSSDSHRMIAWDKIGPKKPTELFAKTHRFPVQGEADLRFNYEMTDHEALAKAISYRSADYRFCDAIGGDKVVQALATGKPAPYFLARKDTWSGSETFRITVVGRNLLLVKVGAGTMQEKPQYNAFGAVGAIAAAGPVWRYLKFKEAMGKLERKDECELLRVAGEFDGSFIIKGEDIRGIKPELPTGFQSFMSGGQHAGWLVIDRVAEQPLKLQFVKSEDALNARPEIAKLSS